MEKARVQNFFFCSLELSICCYNSPLTFQHHRALLCSSVKTWKVQILLVIRSTTVDQQY